MQHGAWCVLFIFQLFYHLRTWAKCYWIQERRMIALVTEFKICIGNKKKQSFVYRVVNWTLGSWVIPASQQKLQRRWPGFMGWGCLSIRNPSGSLEPWKSEKFKSCLILSSFLLICLVPPQIISCLLCIAFLKLTVFTKMYSPIQFSLIQSYF